LTPGGSSSHLHTNSTHNTKDGTHITIINKKLGRKKRLGREKSLVGGKIGQRKKIG
jgi:hypothetical protein